MYNSLSSSIFFIAAKLGEVCYSDTHCTLSDENNRCEFTIPGVFGFCVCNSASQDCAHKGQDSTLVKPNSSAFKYPFSKPDLKKKVVPYHKRPWQTDDLRPTPTAKPALRPVTRPLQTPPLKRPILKPNFTNNGMKFTAVPVATNTQPSVVPLLNYTSTTALASKNITFSKPQLLLPSAPTPLKDSQNKSQTTIVNSNSSVKVHKKPITNTGNFAGLRGQ